MSINIHLNDLVLDREAILEFVATIVVMNGPEIFQWNANKLFPNAETRTPKQSKRATMKGSTLKDDKDSMMVSDIVSQCNDWSFVLFLYFKCWSQSRIKLAYKQFDIFLAGLESARDELKEVKLSDHYQREMHLVMTLRDDVICMELVFQTSKYF